MRFEIVDGFLRDSTWYFSDPYLNGTGTVYGKAASFRIPSDCIKSIKLLENKQVVVYFTITFTNDETSTCKTNENSYKQISELKLCPYTVPFEIQKKLHSPFDKIGGYFAVVAVFAIIAIIILVLFKACSFATSLIPKDEHSNDPAAWYVKKGAVVCDSEESFKEERERIGQGINELADGCTQSRATQRILMIGYPHFTAPTEVKFLDDNNQASGSYWVGHEGFYSNESTR
ncbi:hypothetical protein [Aquirhabdus sp.]|uniref:hypothetical protein n=1 Tax=Aquirhabdus sp. TaxID=2824160 RepID=UPI00396CC263